MTINASIRTPEEVIALPLEDAGLPNAAELAKEIARVLQLCLDQFDGTVVIAGKNGHLGWWTAVDDSK